MDKTLAEQENIAAMLMRLRAQNIQSADILKVFEHVPRHIFFDPEYRKNIYGPQLLPIACGGVCEPIDELAQSIAALDIQNHHRVLEVGCGSGYSSAVLAHFAGRVVSVDRFQTHVEAAIRCHQQLGLDNIVVKQADGAKKVAGEGSFDRILVSSSFEQMPRDYADILAPDGIMLAPMDLKNEQARMMKLTKIGSRFEREDLFYCLNSAIVEGLAAAL